MFQHSVKSVTIDLVHRTHFSHDHFFWHNYCVRLSIPWQVELVSRMVGWWIWLHGSTFKHDINSDSDLTSEISSFFHFIEPFQCLYCALCECGPGCAGCWSRGHTVSTSDQVNQKLALIRKMSVGSLCWLDCPSNWTSLYRVWTYTELYKLDQSKLGVRCSAPYVCPKWI